MPDKATTVRLDPAIRKGLVKLSKSLGRPQNQLVNDAVKQFVEGYAEQLVGDWQATLEQLRAYRKADPTGEKSMAEAMDAEAALELDPAEKPVRRRKRSG